MRKILIGLVALVGVIVIALGAGYAALRRPDIPYEQLEAQFANPQSHWLEMTDGVTLHYRDQGNESGPTILMVHGFSASLHTWEPWVERLAPHYRIVTIDLPGHGLTRAPENYQASVGGFADIIDSFARSQGLSHFTLVGNSMGGNVAWRYALAHPQRVDALVLVDAAGWPPEGEAREGPPPLVFQLINNPVLGPALRQLDNTALARDGLKAAFSNQDLVDEAMVQRYVLLSRAPGHRAILTAIERGEPANEARLGAITAPTLVMHGEEDRLIPVAAGRRFAAAIPGAELAVFAHVGHVPMEEIPDESAHVLQRFLERVYAPAEPAPATTH